MSDLANHRRDQAFWREVAEILGAHLIGWNDLNGATFLEKREGRATEFELPYSAAARIVRLSRQTP